MHFLHTFWLRHSLLLHPPSCKASSSNRGRFQKRPLWRRVGEGEEGRDLLTHLGLVNGCGRVPPPPRGGGR